MIFLHGDFDITHRYHKHKISPTKTWWLSLQHLKKIIKLKCLLYCLLIKYQVEWLITFIFCLLYVQLGAEVTPCHFIIMGQSQNITPFTTQHYLTHAQVSLICIIINPTIIIIPTIGASTITTPTIELSTAQPTPQCVKQ